MPLVYDTSDAIRALEDFIGEIKLERDNFKKEAEAAEDAADNLADQLREADEHVAELEKRIAELSS